MTFHRATRALACLALLILTPCLLLRSETRPHGAFRTRSRRRRRLPANLHLQWVRHLPALKPAWPDQQKLQFDDAYEPVAAGNLVLVGSSRTDERGRLRRDTGDEVWRFVVDGPVRFAPVVWEDACLLSSSDDGYLYCIDAANGELLWKFRGGPSERKILGNERLISTWPARGARRRRRHGLLRRRHLAVHGRLSPRPRRPHRHRSSGPTTAMAPSTLSSRTRPTPSPALRRRAGLSSSATASLCRAVARCRRVTTGSRASCCIPPRRQFQARRELSGAGQRQPLPLRQRRVRAGQRPLPRHRRRGGRPRPTTSSTAARRPSVSPFNLSTAP